MATLDFSAQIKTLRSTYASIEEVSDVEQLRATIAELSEAAGAPDLWDDPDAAQKVTSHLSHKQAELDKLVKLSQAIVASCRYRGGAPWSPRRPAGAPGG